MNLYTIYDWITSLLRTGTGSAFYKAIEPPEEPAAQIQAQTQAAINCSYSVQNVDVELIPTLNFVFEPAPVSNKAPERGQQPQEPQIQPQPESEPEPEQHVASDIVDCSVANLDDVDSDDNDSTRTYIISRSSFTVASTSSSSTPYAITTTDTDELLRLHNNLSLTEDDRTISSFSVEQPTSSISIEMAEQQSHSTAATTATTSEATSGGGHVLPRVPAAATATTTTTTTTTTSSSIEEDIEEAIELSEVEEQLLPSHTDSLAAALVQPNGRPSKRDEPQTTHPSAKSESSEEAAEFRIDDAQLSGGRLAQHFLVDEDSDDEDAEPTSPQDEATATDDDFDISLPLEGRKPVHHSRHEDNEGEESVHGQVEPESLTNQSTTDDVSDFVDEPHQTTTASATEIQNTQDQEEEQEEEEEEEEESDPNGEQDHSMEEILATNESIEITYDADDAAGSNSLASHNLEIVTDLDVVEPPPRATIHTVEQLKLPQLLRPQIVEHKTLNRNETLQLKPDSDLSLNLSDKALAEDDDEDGESTMQILKLRLMAMNQPTLSDAVGAKGSPTESPAGQVGEASSSVEVKQMERIPLTEFSKDVLEDITEESERMLSLSTTAEEPKSLSMEESKTLQEARPPPPPPPPQQPDSSSNMLQQLEAKVQELHSQLESKDNCLASLNLQLEATRRESSTGPTSARDSSSLLTTSTEYRTFQEEFGAPTLDIYVELSRRDDMIAKLTESLKHSLNVRSELQTDSDRLADEVQSLRRQLHEAIDAVKRTGVWSEQQANAGQRISEISMDLISESDDDLDRNFLNDQEERASRASRERQLSVAMDDLGVEPLPPEWPPAFSKQIEQFQKCLLPGELRPFLLVQRKFDDYLTQQLAEVRDQCAQELKISRDQWVNEKLATEEAQQLAHTQQMEELRKYFEHRCADLEKQFSDDVFSHKSQHVGSDSSSECSEVEQLPDEAASKESSPRKRKRAELLLSPSHRQITPSGLGEPTPATLKAAKDNLSQEIADLKLFYQSHIDDLKRSHAEQLRKLTDRLKFYERHEADDDYLSTQKLASTCPKAAVSSEPGADVMSPAANPNNSLIIIDQDELNMNNESQVIQRIIEEYERRLQEQLALARQDMVNELEHQIQSLLSESAVDDQHWPKELILLREKFTAKSQLEITQLNIKHAEEMSRMKLEYEKQLNRKNKRHLTFDSGRDLEHIISERDGLRQLSKSFRSVLCRLAKCVANCEGDLNATISEEMQRILAQSRSQETGDDVEHTLSSSLLQSSFNNTKHLRLVPDVHSLLEVVEDPSLVQFIDSKGSDDQNDYFDLGDCLERLKSEAAYLLQLSEDLERQRANESVERQDETEKQEHELCCEAEDGLKTTASAPQPPTQQQLLDELMRTSSLNDQHLGVAHQRKSSNGAQLAKPHNSLPIDLQQQVGNASELSFQLVELKNRLVKSETDRQNLQQQLAHTIDRNAELGQELQALRDQLSQLNSLNHTDYAEGYGLGDMKTSQALDQSSASFLQLQERARQFLTSPTQQQQTQKQGNATVVLLQMIEDFCREGDKVVESGKKDREDLQSQIDTADKQLKATRQFLEEQAAEREQERDEFQREIEQLKMQLREKEKERSSFANASEEYAQLETQLRDVGQQLSDSNAKREKLEVELKASIDKIFVLREIISDLETQVQTKALNEQVLDEKVKQLEDYVKIQMHSNDALTQEVISLKADIGNSYQTRIRQLEEKLQQTLPSAEQSIVLGQMSEQLMLIEATLEQKIKTLESLHNSNTASNSCSLTVTEDVSAQGCTKKPTTVGSPKHSLTAEGVQRVVEKLDKHTRAEEAAIKRIRDLEMQVSQMRTGCVELQHERDALQGRIDEQTQRITTLQKRLEEQRQRAEQLHRLGTSDLNTRVHELQSEVRNLGEQLTLRDKQMATMQQQLQRSKDEIVRLEAELGTRSQPADRSHVERLEAELQQKCNEVQKMRETMRTEMINRLALPDLMETMLADKNDEIDHLQQQLQAKDRELQAAKDLSQASSPAAAAAAAAAGKQDGSAKHSARTLSDIGSITDFPEPDVERRATCHSLNAPLQLPEAAGGFLHQTMETSKEAVANLTYKRTDDLSGFAVGVHQVNTFDHPHYFQDPHPMGMAGQNSGDLTPALVPRQINFSNLTEDSKLKTPSILLHTPQLPQALPSPSPELQQLKDKLKALEEEKTKQCDELQQQLAQMKEQLTNEKLQVERLQKELRDFEDSETKYRLRIESLEDKILENAAHEAAERDTLRRELNLVSSAHAQCEQQHKDAAAARKRELDTLNIELRAKTECNRELLERLQAAQQRSEELQEKVNTLERDLERLRNSEQSSKQYSVDEIAQQVEKELNYSAQLDSNILKAIESEEENNLDKLQQKEVQTDSTPAGGNGHGTDDENFTGERELLNQLEAMRVQLAVEREQTETLSKELLGEKQHSQEIQEQDVLIIEAMRKRLEAVLEAEDELHKQLDMERERCDRLQTQLTAMQRAESRRSSLLLKSPTDSPRKSPRADFESELCERLRSELKLLTAQNERERERSADAQRNSERERQRYEKELQERVAYCERLKQEMEKLARDKESAELELEHFNERLTLQANEIESLEARMVTLQEAETRRANTRARHHQEQAKLQAEIHELKSKLLVAEASKENLEQKINQLRFDVARSAQRESKLSEALAQANDRLAHSTDDTVPVQFLQKMKEINTLLAENTQENRQMAETVQYLVGERIALQKKCEELGNGGNGSAHVTELEERCRQLLGRYLRVESHRKALVYQKRYLKLTLEGYQMSEQLALQNMAAGAGHKVMMPQPRLTRKKLFKTVALAIIAIQRIKYIGRIWHTGKRIVSKSVFTITQQRAGPSTNNNNNNNSNNNNNNNKPTNSNQPGCLNYGAVNPHLNFSSLQPIVLGHDYTLQSSLPLNNSNNNNNSNRIDAALPSLTNLEWTTTQKGKRMHSRHH